VKQFFAIISESRNQTYDLFPLRRRFSLSNRCQTHLHHCRIIFLNNSPEAPRSPPQASGTWLLNRCPLSHRLTARGIVEENSNLLTSTNVHHTSHHDHVNIYIYIYIFIYIYIYIIQIIYIYIYNLYNLYYFWVYVCVCVFKLDQLLAWIKYETTHCQGAVCNCRIYTYWPWPLSPPPIKPRPQTPRTKTPMPNLKPQRPVPSLAATNIAPTDCYAA